MTLPLVSALHVVYSYNNCWKNVEGGKLEICHAGGKFFTAYREINEKNQEMPQKHNFVRIWFSLEIPNVKKIENVNFVFSEYERNTSCYSTDSEEMYCEIKVDSSNQFKVGTPTKLEHLKGETGDDLARSPIAYSLSPKLSGGKIYYSFCLLLWNKYTLDPKY